MTNFDNQFIKADGERLLSLTVDDFAEVRHLTAGGRKSQSIKGKAEPSCASHLLTNDEAERYIRITVVSANIEVD